MELPVFSIQDAFFIAVNIQSKLKEIKTGPWHLGIFFES